MRTATRSKLAGFAGLMLLLATAVAGCESAPDPAPPDDPHDWVVAPERGAVQVEGLELPGAPGVPDGAQTADPALALDPHTGELAMVWGAESGDAWNLYSARWAPGADGAGPVQRVNDVDDDLHPHAEGAPRLVAAHGVVAAFWNNTREAEGRRFSGSDLRFSRLAPGAEEWTPAISLQDPMEQAGLPPRGHTFHGASLAGDSTLVVAWLDGRERDERRLRRALEQGATIEEFVAAPDDFADPDDPADGDASLYAAVSHDLGASWEDSNRRIHGSACPCCRVGMTRLPGGEVAASWRRHFGDNIRDPVVAVVAPHLPGEPDSVPAQRIHPDEWEFNGCPHSGAGLATTPDGAMVSTWYTGAEGRRGVYVAAADVQGHDPESDGEAASSGRSTPTLRFSEPTPVTVGDRVGIANPTAAMLDRERALVAHNVTADGERAIVLSGFLLEGDGDSASPPELAFQLRVDDSRGGTHPQIVARGPNEAIAAWTVSRDGHSTVQVVRIRWTPDAAAGQTDPSSGSAADPEAPEAPEWGARTLDGEFVSLEDLRGSPVLLNIWATWCIPCVREMPALQELHEELGGRGLQVVGASVDRGQADAAVRQFIERREVTFQILLDPDQEVMSRFRAVGVPETFLIDAEGVIRHRWAGEFDPHAPEARARIERVL